MTDSTSAFALSSMVLSWLEWLDFVLGGAAAYVLLQLKHMARYLMRGPRPSLAANRRPLTPLNLDPAWVRGGVPNVRSTTFGCGIGVTHCGVWEADGPSTLAWQHALDETVYILDGQVDVEYQGRVFSLRPGDSAVFTAGSHSTWTVPHHVRKTYFLERPSAFAQWAGRWRRAIGR